MMRSVAFEVVYWILSVFYALACAVAALFPGRGPLAWALRLYTRRMLWAMHWIAGIKVEVKGEDRLPEGAFIVAARFNVVDLDRYIAAVIGIVRQVDVPRTAAADLVDDEVLADAFGKCADRGGDRCGRCHLSRDFG